MCKNSINSKMGKKNIKAYCSISVAGLRFLDWSLSSISKLAPNLSRNLTHLGCVFAWYLAISFKFLSKFWTFLKKKDWVHWIYWSNTLVLCTANLLISSWCNLKFVIMKLILTCHEITNKFSRLIDYDVVRNVSCDCELSLLKIMILRNSAKFRIILQNLEGRHTLIRYRYS